MPAQMPFGEYNEIPEDTLRKEILTGKADGRFAAIRSFRFKVRDRCGTSDPGEFKARITLIFYMKESHFGKFS